MVQILRIPSVNVRFEHLPAWQHQSRRLAETPVRERALAGWQARHNKQTTGLSIRNHIDLKKRLPTESPAQGFLSFSVLSGVGPSAPLDINDGQELPITGRRPHAIACALSCPIDSNLALPSLVARSTCDLNRLHGLSPRQVQTQPYCPCSKRSSVARPGLHERG